jgi:hypothetical protein
MENDKALWTPDEIKLIPANATSREIVDHAKQLSKRDVQQIISAYDAGNYEMLSAFVWTKAIAALKAQLKSLGMQFVGEMLGRSDIVEGSSIDLTVTDYEAIVLAEDLGMITGTDAMRLRHSLETIVHFARSDSLDSGEQMTQAEAVSCLYSSVQAILGKTQILVAVQFADFRKELEERIFKADDGQMVGFLASPYFHKRTTLNILLALLKTANGAQLANAIGNFDTVLPLIWAQLRKPERWQTGQTYAELFASGRVDAVAGVKKTLARVQGFDFVPENLRSITFSESVQNVFEAHEGMNNFYNEPNAVANLVALGTSIPMPALAASLSAILCVRLGNAYGISYAAQPSVQELLTNISNERWEYYLDECLPGDTRILSKLSQSGPRLRWFDLVSAFKLADMHVKNPRIRKLLEATKERRPAVVANIATDIQRDLGYQR